MAVGDSCTYKVFSKCLWPSFEINSTDVNLWVTTFKGKPSDKDADDDSAIFKKAD
jgi:hypothetical protein